jgi:class 3 adenylate cyclase
MTVCKRLYWAETVAIFCNKRHAIADISWRRQFLYSRRRAGKPAMDQQVAREDRLEDRRRLTTVVAADVCGYSRLAETNEDAAVKTVKIVRAAFERIVAARRGRIFHEAGDGFMAEFPSAADGVLAALEFVADIKARDGLSPTNPGAKVRAGVHSGDVVEQPNGDLLGHGVNIAARLQGEAEPNGVLASHAVVVLMGSNMPAKFEKIGAIELKNINEAIVVYGVRRFSRQRSLFDWLVARKRNIAKAMMTVAALVATILVATISMETSLERRQLELISEKAAIDRDRKRADVVEISRTALALQEDNGTGDHWRAMHSAIESLMETQVPEKASVLELIQENRLDAAAALLARIADKQSQNNAPGYELATTYIELGALIRHSNPQRAQEIYLNALELLPEPSPEILMQLADLALDLPDADLAREYYERLNAFGRKKGRADLQLSAQIGIGRTQNILGRLESAESTFLQALATAERKGLQIEKARCLLFLGSNAYLRSDLAVAEKYMRQATDLEKSLALPDRSPSRIIEAQYSLANVLEAQGKLVEAEGHLISALELAEEIGDNKNMASTLLNLGALARARGSAVQSEKYLNRAMSIVEREPGMNNLKAHIYLSLAEAAQLRGDRKAACLNLGNAARHYSQTAHGWPEYTAFAASLECA